MPVYAAITALSAFLLFLVQPLIAKAILPWFGGAPSVWTTCLLFFQSALLAGYAYAHVTRQLTTKRQVILHVTLLLLTLITLPIIPSVAWRPHGEESPAFRILGLLGATVGAPYLMLATTAPLLQDWFGREAVKTPYRLYAWSNAGSLLALIGYPFLFERLLTVPQQARFWSAAYILFVAGCLLLGLRVVRVAKAKTNPVEEARALNPEAPPQPGDRILWFMLAMCGSGLLMAITDQLTLDVASVPFLWVLPLALYLLTFIVSFGGYYRRAVWRPAFIVGLGIMAVLYKLGAAASLLAQISGSSFALFTGCMLCHGELVRLSPRPRYLTSFYLTMSAGGAAGGVIVALVAPLVFSDFWELPIFLLLPYLLLTFASVRESPSTRRPVTGLARAGIAWLGGAAFLAPVFRENRNTLESSRNFYGVLRVIDDYSDSLHPKRHLRHGRITHGTQLLAAGETGKTTAYYAERSGVEIAIDHHPRREQHQPLTVGAVGLGVGTIAAYGAPSDTFRFFEINPDVERLARAHFTFLKDSKAVVSVVLGDGRLSIEREVENGEGQHRYDVLVLDAFAGDAIPVHLLTEEAMALYWQALKEDGILAVHTSNRYLNLARVVTGLAPKQRKRVIRIERGHDYAAFGSTWLLVTSNRDFMKYVTDSVKFGADVPNEPPVVWTDAFSNLYDVLGDEGS
jgi:spermidine synthase